MQHQTHKKVLPAYKRQYLKLKSKGGSRDTTTPGNYVNGLNIAS